MPSIFESKETMPPEDNDSVVRTAMTASQARRNTLPPSLNDHHSSVRNVERPRFGHKAE